jgi:polysaccharide biosynthesis protein PslH
MNILFVVPYTPNLVRVRPYNFIRHLAELGHQITLVTIANSAQDREDIEHLREYCVEIYGFKLPRWRSLANCLLAVGRKIPLQAVYCWNPEMAKFLQELTSIKRFDVVHVEHLRGAEYGLKLRENGMKGGAMEMAPVIFDSVDCISLLFGLAANQTKRFSSRLMTRFELTRTRRYEANLEALFDYVLVTSPLDRKAFLELSGAQEAGGRISVIPNGVDLIYFSPDTLTEREEQTLVISGKMSYHANVSMVLNFVEQVLPLIWNQQPAVKLWIVGKDPTAEIRALASDPRITVTGSVPDIRPYLRRATLAVTPITYGVGIQNKVLEAMACATPVVSTSQAVSALAVVPGRDILVADGADSLAKEILDLIGSRSRQAQIGAAGRKSVEEHHQWLLIAEHLENLYTEAIRKNQMLLSKSASLRVS